jgi:hypothetical protein
MLKGIKDITYYQQGYLPYIIVAETRCLFDAISSFAVDK